MSHHTHLMLGPGRPEVDCDECFRMLDQYVDAEVRSHDAAATFPTFAAHLDGCPVCHEEYESLLQLVGTHEPPNRA